MRSGRRTVVGALLIIAGLLVVIFREQIVFPGLERLLGIETIVGKENVVYQDGGYVYTNPGAMMRWTSSVGLLGILICGVGGILLLRALRRQRGHVL